MDDLMETFVPLTFRRRGVQRVATDECSVHDVTLLDGVARAFYWQHLLDTGAMQSGSAIARAEKLHHSVFSELLRLTLLAPDQIEGIAPGRLEVGVSQLLRGKFSASWLAQREALVAALALTSAAHRHATARRFFCAFRRLGRAR